MRKRRYTAADVGSVTLTPEAAEASARKKRKPTRRKREPTTRTHAQWLEIAHWAEVGGDREKADWIRKMCKQRFRAEMCFNGQNRDFAVILTDEEILALPPPKSFPFLK